MRSVALFRRPGAVLVTCSVAVTTVLALGTVGTASAAGRVAAADVAPGAPGAPSYFDLARKDCVGTATGTRSKVWYTVAGGALSDVYEPTIDNTNVSTLQYIVTDGSTFTDVQTRDMTYTVAADPTGMACTVTAANTSHGYQLTTTYITDPARDTVLMRTRLAALPGSGTDLAGLHVYARLDAHVNGNGGGGVQNAGANSGVIDTSTGSPVPVISSTNTVTNAVNRDYAVPTYMALGASVSSGAASVGYADSFSDGLIQLDLDHALTPFDSAPDGHITATEEVTPARGRPVTLGPGVRPRPGLGGGDGAPFAAPAVRGGRAELPARLDRLRRWAAAAVRAGVRGGGPAGPRRHTPLLSVGQRDQGQRGQDLPRRDRGVAGQPVGAGGAGGGFHQRRAVLLRLLPGGVRPGPLRGVHRAARRRGPGDRARRDAVLVRPPAAGGWVHAAQLAAQRRGRPGHRRDPAGRDVVPDRDGAAGGPGRERRAVARPHQARGRFPGRARAVVRRGAVGGADRVLAVHDRRRDRRADRGVGDRRGAP